MKKKIMITKAVIVNDNFIVSQEIEYIYQGQIKVNCDAILKAFMASRSSEVEGGILYVTGCPDLADSGMIIAAKLSKVIYNRTAITSDEMCALELLKEHNIEVIYNPNIIL